MTLEGKIREIVDKVAINGTKGTGDNINQRVVIQATTDIINLFKESLPKKRITTSRDSDKIKWYETGSEDCLEEILNKLEK